MKGSRKGKPASRQARSVFRRMATVAAIGAVLWLLPLAVMALSRRPWVKRLWLRFDQVENPIVGRIAGRPVASRFYFGFQLGLLRHVGRKSGRAFATPLGAYPFGDGFIFALFYGPDVDWARNVLAAGGGTLEWRGKEYALERPEIIPASEVLGAYPLYPRLTLMAAGTKEFLWVHLRPDVSAKPATGISSLERGTPVTEVAASGVMSSATMGLDDVFPSDKASAVEQPHDVFDSGLLMPQEDGTASVSHM